MVEWMDYCGVRVPADPGDVQKAAVQARLPVPNDVQQLLLAHQGQATAPEVIALPGGGTVTFGTVLVVTPGAAAPGGDDFSETYTVDYAVAALQEFRPTADGKPDFFPFASDTASGWFCVDQRDPAQRIVFIATDGGAEDDGVIPLAATVTDLLGMLRD